eukprot:TRINITY_DN21628_c0_g1_i1.p1 TRINITY_DN21628_c0_g1~~TRINITY_DN21628_c0_g1_i1.p1  ORF type:complete len:158 (+),score=21.06 TRINITY_DN21628_c0_g1_i1:53-526(+)
MVSERLFDLLDSSNSRVPVQCKDPIVVGWSNIRIDERALGNASVDVLDLDGKVYTLRLKSGPTRGMSSTSCSYENTQLFSDATLVFKGSGAGLSVMGSFRLNHNNFAVEGIGDGAHVLMKKDFSRVGEECGVGASPKNSAGLISSVFRSCGKVCSPT